MGLKSLAATFMFRLQGKKQKHNDKKGSASPDGKVVKTNFKVFVNSKGGSHPTSCLGCRDVGFRV